MTDSDPRHGAVNDRVANYRVRTDRKGLERLETIVSTEDVNLIEHVARILRENEAGAAELRTVLRSLLPTRRARTGEELLAYFQEFPRSRDDDDDAVEFVRDGSNGRIVDFE